MPLLSLRSVLDAVTNIEHNGYQQKLRVASVLQDK